MHSPTLKDVIAYGTMYVTVASAAVNLLPKDTFLNDFPRAKKVYNAFIAFLAGSALNLRTYLPALQLHIPGLGFQKPASTPESSQPARSSQ